MCFLHLALFSMTKYLIGNIYSEAVLEKDKGGNCAIPRLFFIVLSHSTFTFQIASIKTWWSPRTRMLSVIFSADGETVTDSDQPAQDPADPGLATALYKLSFVESIPNTRTQKAMIWTENRYGSWCPFVELIKIKTFSGVTDS